MDKSILILIPLYFAYIIGIGFYMFTLRKRAVKNKDIHGSYFKDYQGEAPYDIKIVENHYVNQLQIPVVFFVACIAAVALKTTTTLTLVLSYSFVLSRLVHSYFHLGKNNVLMRALAYFIGLFIVLCMWIEIYLRI